MKTTITTHSEYLAAEKELNSLLPFQHLDKEYKRVIELSGALDTYVAGFENSNLIGTARIEGI